MNSESRNALVLAVISLIAFLTIIFGFARIGDGFDSELTFAEEKQQLVETAQLWYIRPAGSGGGNMAFDSLDFYRTGQSGAPGCVDWNGVKGRYAISSRHASYFVLSSQPVSGSGSEIDTIRFDTLP